MPACLCSYSRGKRRFSFLSLFALLCSTCSYAEIKSDTDGAIPFESGFWEVTTRPDFPGIPGGGAKVDKGCLTVGDIKRGYFPLRISPFCSVKGGALVGNRLELKVECPGYPNVKGGGEAILAGNAFTGKIAIPGGEGSPVPINTTFSYFYTGRKVAECPAN